MTGYTFHPRFANDAPAEFYQSTAAMVAHIEAGPLAQPEAQLRLTDIDGFDKELSAVTAVGDTLTIIMLAPAESYEADKLLANLYYAPRGWVDLDRYHKWHDVGAARAEKRAEKFARLGALQREEQSAASVFKLEAIAHLARRVA